VFIRACLGRRVDSLGARVQLLWGGEPVGFRFCGACGAPLGAGEGRRERRVVSILLADLVGFTSRSERLDVEDVEAFLEPYRDLLRRVQGRIPRLPGSMSVIAAPDRSLIRVMWF
jgi:class 3 adenylate cyclase